MVYWFAIYRPQQRKLVIVIVIERNPIKKDELGGSLAHKPYR
jgi:hypothetical protein